MEFIGIESNKIALIFKEKTRVDLVIFSEFNGDVKQLYKENTELVTGLKSNEMILRSMTLKLKSKREILAALPFQVETLIPYKSEDTILLPTLSKKKDETEIFLLATSKETLAKHLSSLDFEPDIVSAVPVALWRFSLHFFKQYTSLFLQHEDIFVVIQDGKLHASHTASAEGLERISAYLQKKYPSIDHFFSTTGANTFPHFIQLELENPEMGAYAVPIGLALDGALKGPSSAQFRQKDQISTRHALKMKKRIKAYAALCLTCFMTVTLMGQLHLKKREKAVLLSLGAPKGISLARYADTLQNAVLERKTAPITISPLPSLSEVLAWLSTHPALAEGFSISHLHYEMVKAPKLGTSARKYETKVDLELETSNPRAARAFHEALRQDNVMVNRKMNIKWTADHGVYRATFFLKEKRNG